MKQVTKVLTGILVVGMLVVVKHGGAISAYETPSGPDSWMYVEKADFGTITVDSFHRAEGRGIQDSREANSQRVWSDLYAPGETGIHLASGGHTGPSGLVILTKSEPCIALEKTGPETAQPGETITYTFSVSNCGDTVLNDAYVEDALFDDVLWSGVLEPGETYSFEMPYTLPENSCGPLANEAWAGGFSPHGVEACGEDEWVVEVICPNPDIEVVKTPDTQSVDVGGTAGFTITVINTGDVDLDSVTVADPLAPACAAMIDSLVAGASTSYVCALSNVVESFTNVVLVTGTMSTGDVVTDTDDAYVMVGYPGIEVSKTPDAQSVESGGTVTFTISVVNTGDVDLGPVTVVDVRVPGCDLVTDTLPAGSGLSYQCTASNVTESFTNVAVATGTTPGGSTVSDQDDAQVTVLGAGIQVSKTPDIQSVEAGGTVTFTITVSNTGSVALGPVTVTDVLAPSCGSEIASLPAGASETYQCTVSNVSAPFTNVAVVTGTTPEGNTVSDQDDAQVTVLYPGIEVSKTPDVQPAEPGGTVTFTISVANTGEVDLGSITVSDPLAPGCEFAIEALAVGASENRQCVVNNVTESFTNVVFVTGTTSTGEVVTYTDDANVVLVSLEIEKLVGINQDPTWYEADAAPGPEVAPGTPVWFWFVVTNAGDADLENLTLSDSVFDLASYSQCTPPAAGLPAGETFSCVIDGSQAQAGQHVDTATVTGVFSGRTYSAQDPAYYLGTAPSEASITVEKYLAINGEPWFDADDWLSAPDVSSDFDTIYFRFVISNTGSVPLTGITLVDSGIVLSNFPQCTPPLEIAPGDEPFVCEIGPFPDADLGILVDRCEHTNTATATGTYGGALYSDTDDVRYYGPDYPACLELVSLTLEPTSVAVRVGQRVALQAIAVDVYGRTWDATDRTVFSISPAAGGFWNNNVYTSQAPGTWAVTGQYGDNSAATALHASLYTYYMPMLANVFPGAFPALSERGTR